MQFCYGDMNHIRMLEEAEFWKRQESEHTVVIREIVGNLEKEFEEKSKDFQRVFSSTESTIMQYIERLNRSCYEITPEVVENIINIISNTISQSQAFINFLNNMMKDSTAVKNTVTAPVVINHIIRESKYYIGIAKAYLSNVS